MIGLFFLQLVSFISPQSLPNFDDRFHCSSKLPKFRPDLSNSKIKELITVFQETLLSSTNTYITQSWPQSHSCNLGNFFLTRLSIKDLVSRSMMSRLAVSSSELDDFDITTTCLLQKLSFHNLFYNDKNMWDFCHEFAKYVSGLSFFFNFINTTKKAYFQFLESSLKYNKSSFSSFFRFLIHRLLCLQLDSAERQYQHISHGGLIVFIK